MPANNLMLRFEASAPDRSPTVSASSDGQQSQRPAADDIARPMDAEVDARQADDEG